MTSDVATPVVRPADLAAVRAALLDTSGPLAVAGAGTAVGWAGPLRPVETVLDTTGLAGVITHNPGDMTVSVRAGTPLRALQDELAPHGQHVSFDAARVAEVAGRPGGGEPHRTTRARHAEQARPAAPAVVQAQPGSPCRGGCAWITPARPVEGSTVSTGRSGPAQPSCSARSRDRERAGGVQ